ncbi:MAG TPA: prenyltransferase/squalene oxidase repeat-containing protein, partial [Thermoguttaceae bacterium]|nr:prenyltransferase/squalene oxidase repeat-containing protein [Thermoguttaceae bacterium]
MPTAGGDPHLPKMSGTEPPSVRSAEASREKDVLDRDIFDRQGAGAGESAGAAGVGGDQDVAAVTAAAEEDSSPGVSHSAPGEIWLDGGVLACACPGCGAPMSIRLWLRAADCWRCGTSIELTEEQEQAAWRLLRQQAAQQPPAQPSENLSAKTSSSPAGGISAPKKSPPALPLVSPKGKPTRPKETALPKEGSKAAESPWADSPSGTPALGESGLPGERRESGQEKSASSAAHLGVSEGKGTPAAIPRRRILAAERAFRQRLRQAQQGRPWRLRIQDWLKNLPAWLVSLLLHMAALLLLALWIPENQKETALILSDSIGPYDLETELGHQPEIKVLRPEFDEGGLAFEPLSVKDILGDPTLEWDPLDSGLRRPLSSKLPPNPLIEAPTPALQPGSLLRGRDPNIRNQILYSQGGTSVTEAAVARALRWISRHQNPNGSFSLHAFHRTADCQGQCDGAGVESDVAGTALALLPMLGAGQTHRQGEYAQVVRAALAWLLERQKPNGDLQDSGFGRMYAHGLASIVLCEAYALTGDSQLREAAQLALDFIVKAQHPAGGWRYQPGEAGDTSMVGWQLMALNSGRM